MFIQLPPGVRLVRELFLTVLDHALDDQIMQVPDVIQEGKIEVISVKIR